MTDLSPGDRVHRWRILSIGPPATSPSGRARARWNCRCECGTEKLVLDQSLRLALRRDAGGSRSCGCLLLERSLQHGHNRAQRPTPEYMSWLGAKKRCQNPKNDSFYRYGGRGIEICAEWDDSFETFLRDMGPKPDPSYSLDRIDPNGHYEPGNCRWAPSGVQSRNRSGICWYGFEGQPALLSDIAAFFGITRDAAKALARSGLLRRLEHAPRVPDHVRPLVLDLNLVPSGERGHCVSTEG
jgi:hypothetical protein